MSKPEWGIKRNCPHCKARFYDLNRNPPVCPKCQTELTVERVAKKTKPAKPVKEEVKAPDPERAAKPPVDDEVDDADEIDEIDDLDDVDDVNGDDSVDFDVDAADNPMIEGADDLDDDDDVPVFSPARKSDDGE